MTDSERFNLGEINLDESNLTINVVALRDANNIDKFLREKCPSGTLISKNSIRLKFNLPYVRSSLIFRILEDKGYEIQFKNIRVP